jgi:hypothetical protein
MRVDAWIDATMDTLDMCVKPAMCRTGEVGRVAAAVQRGRHVPNNCAPCCDSRRARRLTTVNDGAGNAIAFVDRLDSTARCSGAASREARRLAGDQAKSGNDERRCVTCMHVA